MVLTRELPISIHFTERDVAALSADGNSSQSLDKMARNASAARLHGALFGDGGLGNSSFISGGLGGLGGSGLGGLVGLGLGSLCAGLGSLGGWSWVLY